MIDLEILKFQQILKKCLFANISFSQNTIERIVKDKQHERVNFRDITAIWRETILSDDKKVTAVLQECLSKNESKLEMYSNLTLPGCFQVTGAGKFFLFSII